MNDKTSAPLSVDQIKRFYAFVIFKSFFDIAFAVTVMIFFTLKDENFFQISGAVLQAIRDKAEISEFQNSLYVLLFGVLYFGVVFYKSVKTIIFIFSSDPSRKYDVFENEYDSFLEKINKKYISNHRWSFFLWAIYIFSAIGLVGFSEAYDPIRANGIWMLLYNVLVAILLRIIVGRTLRNYLGELSLKKVSAKAKLVDEETDKEFREAVDQVYGKAPSTLQNSAQKEECHQANINNIDTLLKYKKLLDMGAITEEEFEQKKQEMLK